MRTATRDLAGTTTKEREALAEIVRLEIAARINGEQAVRGVVVVVHVVRVGFCYFASHH